MCLYGKSVWDRRSKTVSMLTTARQSLTLCLFVCLSLFVCMYVCMYCMSVCMYLCMCVSVRATVYVLMLRYLRARVRAFAWLPERWEQVRNTVVLFQKQPQSTTLSVRPGAGQRAVRRAAVRVQVYSLRGGHGRRHPRVSGANTQPGPAQVPHQVRPLHSRLPPLELSVHISNMFSTRKQMQSPVHYKRQNA